MDFFYDLISSACVLTHVMDLDYDIQMCPSKEKTKLTHLWPAFTLLIQKADNEQTEKNKV